MGRKVEVGAVASVRTQFSRQQPDESKLRPLPNPEGLEQLLLGVFYGERDRVHGGNWQRAPRAANAFSSKVLRIEPRIKSIRREGKFRRQQAPVGSFTISGTLGGLNVAVLAVC